MDNQNNDVLYLSVATIFAGLVGVVVKYFFKSRCVNFSCCYGLISVQRDSKAENEIEIEQIQHGVIPEQP